MAYSVDSSIEGTNVSGSCEGIQLMNSHSNTLVRNISSNNCYGIILDTSSSNTLTNNVLSNNDTGIWLGNSSDNNKFYFNDLVDNSIDNVESHDSTNIWNSPEQITYTYNGNTHTSYLGNYWSDYEGKYPDAEEIDSTGIWDTPYSIDSDADNYPLMEPFENYMIGPPPSAVGGEVYPINKVAVLAPWLALLAAIVAGAAMVMLRFRLLRRRGSSQ